MFITSLHKKFTTSSLNEKLLSLSMQLSYGLLNSRHSSHKSRAKVHGNVQQDQ